MSDNFTRFSAPEGVDPASHFATLIGQLFARCDELEAQVLASGGVPSVSNIPTPPTNALAVGGGGRRKLPDPERYSGRREGVRTFVDKVDNVLAGERASFTDDESRKAYLVALLHGDAYAWYSNLKEQLPRTAEGFVSITYVELKERLLLAFRDSDEEATARRKAEALRQKAGSAQDYAIKFRQFAHRTGWNDSTQQDHFRHGLTFELQKVLAPMPPSRNLDELVNLATTVDDRLFRFRESTSRGNAGGFTGRQGLPPRRTPVYNYPPGDNLGNSGYDKMDLSATGPSRQHSRGPLSESEKKRRSEQGLCLYCGEKHSIEKCAKLAAKERKAGERQFVLSMDASPSEPDVFSHHELDPDFEPKN